MGSTSGGEAVTAVLEIKSPLGLPPLSHDLEGTEITFSPSPDFDILILKTRSHMPSQIESF